MTIKDDICDLLDAGEARADIRINDGNDEWGETGACTAAMADDLIESWQDDGQDTSDLPSLETLDEYEQRTGTTTSRD